MPPRNYRNGYTLIEIMISMFTSAILALTAGSLIFFFFKGWHRDSQAVELQRDGTIATEFLSRSLRAASLDQITVFSGQIDIGSVTATERFYVSGKNFLYDPNTGEAGDEVTLVSGLLESFSPLKGPRSISYQLIIDNGDERSDIRSTINPRN